MKIELKSIKFSERFSEETNCFTANLYVNNKKVGYAKNEGRGGPTSYYIDNQELREQIEQYCKSLPTYKSQCGTFEMPMNAEYFIDDLIEAYLKNKDEDRIVKIREKHRKSFIQNGFDVLLEVRKGDSIAWFACRESSKDDAILRYSQKHNVDKSLIQVV